MRHLRLLGHQFGHIDTRRVRSIRPAKRVPHVAGDVALTVVDHVDLLCVGAEDAVPPVAIPVEEARDRFCHAPIAAFDGAAILV